MNVKEWLTTGAVAIGGGALTGGLAAILDPQRFNFRDGVDEGHIAEMAVEGAAVALGGLFLRSPLGHDILGFIERSQAQTAEDRAAIDKAKKNLKS